jgi:hypothetical protein
MNNHPTKNLLSSCLLASALAVSPLLAETAPTVAAPAAKPISAERGMLASVSATVTALDQTTREISLKGPQGNVVTLVVDPMVKRLAEVQVGDSVVVDYYISVAGELRAPTAEEEMNPIVITEAAAKAPTDTTPGVGAVRMVKMVAKVSAVDATAMTVALTGPGGNSVTVEAKDPAKLAHVKVGDTILVTYTEAVAVSLAKAPAAAAK